jgi:hypothetical protein
MPVDRYGLPLSSSSLEACERYVAGVDVMLSYQPGADTELQAALSVDPGFAMAHAALARHFQMWGRTADARASIANAQACSTGISPREQQHIGILAALIGGRPVEALRCLHEHLQDYSRDAIALATALAATLIETHLGEIVRVGGSGAQRDLFEDTLATAQALTGNAAATERTVLWRRLRGLSASN